MRRLFVSLGLVTTVALTACGGGSYDVWTGNEREECDIECQRSEEIAMHDFAAWCHYEQSGEVLTSEPSGDLVS